MSPLLLLVTFLAALVEVRGSFFVHVSSLWRNRRGAVNPPADDAAPEPAEQQQVNGPPSDPGTPTAQGRSESGAEERIRRNQVEEKFANKIFGYLARCEFWLKIRR